MSLLLCQSLKKKKAGRGKKTEAAWCNLEEKGVQGQLSRKRNQEHVHTAGGRSQFSIPFPKHRGAGFSFLCLAGFPGQPGTLSLHENRERRKECPRSRGRSRVPAQPEGTSPPKGRAPWNKTTHPWMSTALIKHFQLHCRIFTEARFSPCTYQAIH